MLWLLFGAGGTLAALLFPAWLLVIGVLLPLELVPDAALDFDRVRGTLGRAPASILAFALIVLPLFHAAHRLLHTVPELGLRSARGTMAAVCYGAVALSAVAAVALLWRL